MKEIKKSAVCVGIAVVLCYVILMLLGNAGILKYMVPLVCFIIFSLVSAILKSISAVADKKGLRLGIEAVLTALLAVGLILM